MKEYNTKLTFGQVMNYFIPAIAVIALLISANNAITVGSQTGDVSLVVWSIVSLIANAIVIGKYVIDNAKKDKSTKSE